jgi:cytosine/adenosine deaminase-related metal-dependent hydrolase
VLHCAQRCGAKIAPDSGGAIALDCGGMQGAADVTETILAAEALLGADYRPAGPTEIVIDAGRITAIRPVAPGTAVAGLALPAPVNGHDHARPLSATSFGLAGEPLETWLTGLAVMPAVDAGLAARAALARSALGGVAAAMVHLTRPMGLIALEAEAHQIADAAEAVGVRIALALSMRDRNPLVYGDHGPVMAGLAESDPAAAEWLSGLYDRPMPPPAEQVAMVEAVAKALEGRGVDVQFGPTGPQWCSPALLEAIAEASERTGRRVHMHFLETRYQRDWAAQAYPGGLGPWLGDIGFLSPRLSLAHCTWAGDADLEAIAGSGATVVVNTSSNLHLNSGIAPVGRMLAAGVKVAMGLDGCAFDEDDDALREIRLLRALHGGTGFDPVLTPVAALRAACATGRPALGLPSGGVLEVGAPADVLLLDLAALDRDGLLPVDPRALLMTRARRDHIKALRVGGRLVVQDGRLTGFDGEAAQEALRAAYRAALPGTERFRAAWPALKPAMAAWYRDRLGCC